MVSHSIIDDLKHQKILDLLEKGERTDGRAFDEPRENNVDRHIALGLMGIYKVAERYRE